MNIYSFNRGVLLVCFLGAATSIVIEKNGLYPADEGSSSGHGKQASLVGAGTAARAQENNGLILEDTEESKALLLNFLQRDHAFKVRLFELFQVLVVAIDDKNKRDEEGRSSGRTGLADGDNSPVAIIGRADEPSQSGQVIVDRLERIERQLQVVEGAIHNERNPGFITEILRSIKMTMAQLLVMGAILPASAGGFYYFTTKVVSPVAQAISNRPMLRAFIVAAPAMIYLFKALAEQRNWVVGAEADMTAQNNAYVVLPRLISGRNLAMMQAAFILGYIMQRQFASPIDMSVHQDEMRELLDGMLHGNSDDFSSICHR